MLNDQRSGVGERPAMKLMGFRCAAVIAALIAPSLPRVWVDGWRRFH